MSTANHVPETWQLTGDDAKETLARTGRAQLVKDAVIRLRSSDGFSHARSMAFLLILVFVQAVIAAVGIASAVGSGGFGDGIVKALRTIVPGPAGHVLTTAVEQARQAGSSGGVAIVVGTIGALVTGTTLMGQVERALNRLYGIERDRDTVQKYARAFVLALTAGVASVFAIGALGLGGPLASSMGGGTARTIWDILRWPLGLAMLVVAVALIFRWSPRRHQPAWSWLSFGAMASVGLLALVTLAMNLFFAVSSSFGAAYGPLAGVIALGFWAFFSSVALLMGAALAAQLEAVRAGARPPRRNAEAPASEVALDDLDGHHASMSPSS